MNREEELDKLYEGLTAAEKAKVLEYVGNFKCRDIVTERKRSAVAREYQLRTWSGFVQHNVGNWMFTAFVAGGLLRYLIK